MGFCKLHKFKIVNRTEEYILYECKFCNFKLQIFGDHITLIDYDKTFPRKNIYYEEKQNET